MFGISLPKFILADTNLMSKDDLELSKDYLETSEEEGNVVELTRTAIKMIDTIVNDKTECPSLYRAALMKVFIEIDRIKSMN